MQDLTRSQNAETAFYPKANYSDALHSVIESFLISWIFSPGTDVELGTTPILHFPTLYILHSRITVHTYTPATPVET